MKNKYYLLSILTLVCLVLVQISYAEPNTTDKDKLSSAVSLYIGSSTAVAQNLEGLIDESNPKVVPFIENGRTLVPVRFISEKFGAKVDWNSSSKTVTINSNDTEVKLVINSNVITVNGEDLELDVSAQIKNDRTFIPLRILSESLGKKVFYDRGLVIISDFENIFDIASEKNKIDELISRVNNLPSVKTVANLKDLLKQDTTYTNNKPAILKNKEATVYEKLTADSAGGVASENQTASRDSHKDESSDFSTTNVQVEGVDESDVIKTDGKYIYKINNGKVLIINAYPADEMNIISKIDLDNKEFNPQEIYVTNNKLVIIGQSHTNIIHYDKQILEEDSSVDHSDELMRIMPIEPIMRDKTFTKAFVYDITDKEKPSLLKSVEIEGSYVSSRMVNSSLYLISNKWFEYHLLENSENTEITPLYKDSTTHDEYVNVELSSIRYFPDAIEPNYLTVASFDLNNLSNQANISTYLGSAGDVYSSTENLYVTANTSKRTINPDYVEPKTSDDTSVQSRKMISPSSTSIMAEDDMWVPMYDYENFTVIYKFSLGEGKTTYLGKGEVNGRLLNQFSMDENNGYFRVATTIDQKWSKNGEILSKNNLFILDENLKPAGKIIDIAPGERIYSVRFMGDRAYMVTFRNIDPLFVIDVSSPSNPKILGALKIPGYSDYLHPYDENHIIGFGKDTTVIKDNVYHQGMKIALFDVSDVSNPKEKFVEYIGDRGTDSELLRNHKALLFSKSKNIFAFPVTLLKVPEGTKVNPNYPPYGQFSNQAAYIYSLDLDKGFNLKGTISHLSEEDLNKAATYWADSNKFIERILYIDDYLYTASQRILKANDINSLKEISQISLD